MPEYCFRFWPHSRGRRCREKWFPLSLTGTGGKEVCVRVLARYALFLSLARFVFFDVVCLFPSRKPSDLMAHQSATLRAWVLYSCDSLHKTTHTYAPNHDHVHRQRSHSRSAVVVVMINFPFSFSFRNLSCHLSQPCFFFFKPRIPKWIPLVLFFLIADFHFYRKRGFGEAIFRNKCHATRHNTSILGVTLLVG